ncbi:MAG: hypothetical protein HOP12_03255 [Candidatus Eisenbacteria bacterium]|uniref:Uncharacterized protein n=1 Tax=Eiseniibacteriota bacterium TaxID=2212470 RepID=A0A849SK02_UNCEI|nr:hypothetical protein [Candidatus Eisenbacteria bacterium]
MSHEAAHVILERECGVGLDSDCIEGLLAALTTWKDGEQIANPEQRAA